MQIGGGSVAAGRALLAGSVLAVLLAACGDDEPDAPDDPIDAGADAGGVDAGDAAVDAGAGLDPRFEALAAAIESDIEASNATAASVAVWLDGEILWVGGFGDLGEGSGPIDEDTLFMIGSDTKKITAIGLLRRVEGGDVTLETTVGDVLPDLEMAVAPDFVGATIHDLLSHQGGLVDGVEVVNETEDGELRDFVLGQLARTYYQMAPPGRIWNYSNPNFSVAGLLDEELDGRPWADIVEQDVFAPLGMSRTVARRSEVDANHALGVGLSAEAEDDQTIEAVPLDETWESAFVRPAGLVWSTPSDQMRLAEFLVDGDDGVLGDELRQQVSAAQVPMYPDVPGDYGYGLMVGRGLSLHDGWHDVLVWSHGGNTRTHSSTFYVLPEQRFAISILSNGLGDDFTLSVAAAFESLVDLPGPTEGPSAPFDPDGLDALVGSYFDDFNAGELILSREGDALRVDAPLLDELGIPYVHEMTPLSTRVWMVNVQGTDLDFAFIDGPDGETYFRNRALVAIRPAPGAPAHLRAPRRGPRPDAAALRAALRRARWDALPPLMRPSRPCSR